MGTVRPVYEHHSRTYQVSAPVTGGQVVTVDGTVNSGLVIPSGANVDRGKVQGVAADDADLLSNISATDATGKDNFTTVWRDVEINVTYLAACNWGDPLKTAASGQVTKFVIGTDVEGLRIGRCTQFGGVGAGAVGLALIDP